MKSLYISLFLAAGFSNGFADPILAEGKTKIVRSFPSDPSLALFEAKDDITAGDGAKHDVIAGKAEMATATTCHVFRLLSDCGILVAFRKQLDSHRFLGDLCEMIPYEVVVRREAHGSYLKRHPDVEKGQIFSKLVLEFFLKTSNRRWKGMPIAKDDPLIRFSLQGAELFLPDCPIEEQKSFMFLSEYPLQDRPDLFEEMRLMAKKTFLILEKAWQLEGGRLVDFKVEFGLDASGRLLLADVIDNDSWRVIQNEHYIDKQVYRDGGALDRVASLYRQVSDATSRFKLPDQQIILWKDSDFHDLEPFLKHLSPFANSRLKLNQIDCRIANNPKSLYQLLQNKIQETPDTILLCYLHGRNEAASTLSINGTVPLIATAAKRDPSQAGASLSPSSQNPALIAIEPENAALAALQILGSRNPLIYMHLRLNEEERLADLLGLDE